MFPNGSFLWIFSKLPKYKFEGRLAASFSAPRGKAASRSNSPKTAVLTRAECNGFPGGFPLSAKLPEVVSNGRRRWSSQATRCWKCKQNSEIRDFSCASCGALQPPNMNVNYFQLLGVSQTYEIDLEELARKFRNLQMVFHPDKFANKSKEELEISESYSRLLNKAYSTLKDPSNRGFYLLELQKVPTEMHKLQQDFLMKVMEKNEELESIDKLSLLNQFMESNDEAISTQIRLIKEAFRANQVESAQANLLKLNYYLNLDAKIKEKQGVLCPPPNI